MSDPKTKVDRILEILQKANCVIVLGENHPTATGPMGHYTRNCFMVSFDQFTELQELLPNSFSDDFLEREHGLVNLEIRLSPKEQETYYVAAESEPFLDKLWAKNFKTSEEEKL
jgi:hypothetical protein